MTTQDLIRRIFLKLSRYKLLVLLLGVAVAAMLYFYSKTIAPVYSARASVFPLTAAADNSVANSALSSILGITDAPKSFSQEATINIVELAQSRNTRETVAMERLQDFGNKRIAELLIETHNKTKSLFQKSIDKPSNDAMLAAVGGDILKNNMSAKINKNGIMEINFSSANKDLVSPVSYILIEKIAEFYKRLKIQKAQLDYDFTIRKIDSLEDVLKGFDRRAVRMSNTTLFVPSEKLQYQIPKENLVAEKDRVMRQRDASANNREEALWRLQKVTPIIATLDKPDPPFEVKKTSSMLFAFMGLIFGSLLGVLILISGLLYRYAKGEVYKAIFGDEPAPQTVSTTL